MEIRRTLPALSPPSLVGLSCWMNAKGVNKKEREYLRTGSSFERGRMSNHQTSSGNSTERLPTQEGKYSSSISCHIKKSPSLISRRGWPTLSSSSSSYGSHRSLICCGGSSSHIIVGDSEISTGGMSLRSKSKSMQFYDPTKIKRVSDYCTNRSIIAIHDHGKPAFINDMRVLHSAGTAASTTTAATAELSNKEVSDSLNNIRNTLRVKRSYNCVSPPSPMK